MIMEDTKPRIENGVLQSYQSENKLEIGSCRCLMTPYTTTAAKPRKRHHTHAMERYRPATSGEKANDGITIYSGSSCDKAETF
jgi:hypothetical protein